MLASGCSFAASPAPAVIGDPSSGYVHIVSVPPQADVPLSIWFRDPGFADNLSTVHFEFAPGERILIVFPSTPGNGALQINDNACEGGWSIASNVETDVLLSFDGASCRVDVSGSHRVGAVHTDPQTQPMVDPVE
jgi:hypothetical protein